MAEETDLLTNAPALPRGPRRGDQLEVRIEGLAKGAIAVGSFHARIGPQLQPRTYRVEVRKAVPGDRLRIEVETNRRSVIAGRIVEVLSPSPHRGPAPRCPHFGLREENGKGCGGCTLQHVAYPQQLVMKSAILQELLASQGLASLAIRPPLGHDAPWYYRNKMEFSFTQSTTQPVNLGLYRTGWRREVLALGTCFLQSKESADLVAAVGEWAAAEALVAYHPPSNGGFLRTLTIREGRRTGQRLIELTTSGDATTFRRGQEAPAEVVVAAMAGEILRIARQAGTVVSSLYWTQHIAVAGTRTRLEHHLLSGRPDLEEALHLPGGHRLRFSIHPRAFFQTNTEQTEVLYAEVLAAAGLLDGRQVGHALDLYCGTGTIGLCLARYVDRVTGVELQPSSAENARQNAGINGIENAEFLCGDVGAVLAETGLGRDTPVDVVVVDPPRAGLNADARALLAGLAAARLVYVSCNPESLARDLAHLVGRGWRVDSVQPVDMFPHTSHMETVVGLSRG